MDLEDKFSGFFKNAGEKALQPVKDLFGASHAGGDVAPPTAGGNKFSQGDEGGKKINELDRIGQDIKQGKEGALKEAATRTLEDATIGATELAGGAAALRALSGKKSADIASKVGKIAGGVPQGAAFSTGTTNTESISKPLSSAPTNLDIVDKNLADQATSKTGKGVI